MVDRLLQNTIGTPTVTFYEDGVATDPGVVTLNATREDGTALVTAGATGGSGVNPRTFAFTALQLAALDVLKLSWVSATKGTLTTYVEVVGGYVFTLAEARALSPLGNTTLYSTAKLAAYRTLAETALEDACGVAFVPRYAREKVDGNGGTDLLLPDPRPLSVEAATVNGSVVVSSDIELYRSGRAYLATKWTAGRHNVVVKYTHGYAFPPPRVGGACLKLAKRFIVDSPIDDRVIQSTSPDGVSQLYMTAGIANAVFDIPECVAVVEAYGLDKGSVG